MARAARVKKRLVRSPKLYVRDTGLLHTLLEVATHDALAGHPIYGLSWEGLVVETVLAHLPLGWRAGFYRTSHGAEIDLVPRVGRGFHNARADVRPDQVWVVAPVPGPFPLGDDIEACGLGHIARLARAGFPAIE